MTRMSNAEDFHFVGCDDKMIVGTHWHSEGGPRAVVQIAHGMGEHIGRYDRAEIPLSRRCHKAPRRRHIEPSPVKRRKPIHGSDIVRHKRLLIGVNGLAHLTYYSGNVFFHLQLS